ncbi:flagellar hook-length control protein FliK [Bacillus suaedae]|uniref:Flagellar hook-length control protein FliK n=1 Tax=Halalkalibacter suaedae TaxID=2822140 RepID=A0A941ATJ9_9BACI|nr:flagellar hook-length control protein FliK [Bacillus suaedae]MBP3952034.1 flagellar hook-length control protein FliK [Bacillus suaedae]
MNGLTAMSTAQVSQPVHGNSTKNATTNEQGLFAHLLTDVLSGQATKGEEETSTDLSMISELLFSEGEKGSLDDLLANPEVQELWNLLPEQWQQDFKNILQNNDAEDISIWSAEKQALLMLFGLMRQDLSKGLKEAGMSEAATSPQRTNGHTLNQLVFHLEKQSKKEADPLTKVVTMLRNLFPAAQIPAALSSIESVFKQLTTLVEQKGSHSLEGSATNQVKQTITFPEPRPTLGLNTNGTEFGQVMHRAEQAVIHLGENLPKEVQQQQFLKRFQQLIKGSLTLSKDGVQTMSIKLFPENLGRVDVQLTQMNGVITAKFLTSQSSTKELIEGQIAQLRQALIQQNIQVDRIEVTQQYLEQEADAESERQERKNYDSEKSQSNDEDDFQELLDEFNEQI